MKHLYISNSKAPWQLLIKGFVFAIPFILGLVFFYFIFYRNFTYARDLGRLGMMQFNEEYWNCVDTLTTNHVSLIEESEISQQTDSMTIMSIGDSFSQQGIRGYLNYMAENMPLFNFVNLHRFEGDNPERLLMRICEINDSIPNIVIIESVERSFIGRLCSLKFSQKDTLKEDIKNLNVEISTKEKKTFVSWAQEYYKKKIGIDNPVGYFPLSQEVFSCVGHEKDLYFINSKGYGDNYVDSDLDIPDSSRVILAQLKLDSLFHFATGHNVELFYIVAADKYDIYQEYITIAHPNKTTLDDFSVHFEGNKHFLNSKDLILPMIHNGEKDMYYCDDTHWSTKSAKLIGEELAHRIGDN